MQGISGSGLASSGLEAWRAQAANRVLKGLDGDGSGGVSLAEFTSGLQALPAGKAASATSAAGAAMQSSVETAFRVVDADGDGQLSATELRAALPAKGRHGHHPPPPDGGQPDAASGSAGAGGLGSALMAQLLAQGQAVPGAADAGATGSQEGGTNPLRSALDKAMKAMDANGDGQLSASELRSALQARGHHGRHHAAGQEPGGPAAGADAATGASQPGAAQEARRMLLRYALAQGGNAPTGGLSAAA